MHRFLAVAFAALLPTLAPAAPFTLFIYETAADLALRTDTTAAGKTYWDSYATFAAEATKAGILRGGSALQTETATTLSAGGPADTAFATAPLALGGYFQIDVPDAAAAQEWAARLPAAQTGAVEIRAGFAAPGM